MKSKLLNFLRKLVKPVDNPQLLYAGPSLFGPVTVRQAGGKIELRTGQGHLQSCSSLTEEITGSVWDYYLTAAAFRSSDFNEKTICLLGLGVGTTVKLFNKFFSPDRIVGVEVDPVMIDLGRKYFSLNDRNLEIICAGAEDFITKTNEKFDLIITDTFQQDCFSPACEGLEFYNVCRRRLNGGGVMVVNRAATKKQKEVNRQFREKFLKVFPAVYSLAVYWNIFYFGLTQPLGRDQVLRNIRKLGEAKNLDFLQKLNPNELQLVI